MLLPFRVNASEGTAERSYKAAVLEGTEAEACLQQLALAAEPIRKSRLVQAVSSIAWRAIRKDTTYTQTGISVVNAALSSVADSEALRAVHIASEKNDIQQVHYTDPYTQEINSDNEKTYRFAWGNIAVTHSGRPESHVIKLLRLDEESGKPENNDPAGRYVIRPLGSTCVLPIIVSKTTNASGETTGHTTVVAQGEEADKIFDQVEIAASFFTAVHTAVNRKHDPRTATTVGNFL